MCNTLLGAALIANKVELTVKVDPDPCLSMTINKFNDSMEISVMKSTGAAFEYILKRTDAVLDSGDVHSDVAENEALFTPSDSSCAIEIYEITSSNSGKITLLNPADLNTAAISIVRTDGFTDSMNLKAYGAGGTIDASINLKIVVCGDETIVLAGTTTSIFVNELLAAGNGQGGSSSGGLTRRLSAGAAQYSVTNADLLSQFTVSTSDSSTFCGELTYSLFTDLPGTTAWTSTAQVKLETVSGETSQSLTIAAEEAIDSLVYLKAETRGQQSAIKTMFVGNCDRTTSITNTDSDVTKSFLKDSDMSDTDFRQEYDDAVSVKTSAYLTIGETWTS